MKLLISQCAPVARLTFPENRGLVSARAGKMSIQTIFGQIKFAADEPFREWHFPFDHFLPLFLPRQFFGFAPPEFVRPADRLAVHPPISIETFDLRPFRKILRWLENALLDQMRLDVIVDLHLASLTLAIAAQTLNGKLGSF